MIALSSELAFADFLHSRNPDRVARERFNPPLKHVRDRLYDDITQQLEAAMRDQSFLRLKLAAAASRDHLTYNPRKRSAA